MDWQATWVTLTLAAGTIALLLPVGLVIGRWLTQTRRRIRPLAETFVLLPLVLPPTVMGFYFLSAFGEQSPVGRWLADQQVHLIFSFEGLLLASCIANLPFMVQPIQRAFAAIPKDLYDAAQLAGMGSWATFRALELPLALPGIVSGCAMTFAHTLGEFGVVLMVGGAIPGQTKTLSITVYDRVQMFDMQAAHLHAALLLGIAMLALGLAFYAERYRSRHG